MKFTKAFLIVIIGLLFLDYFKAHALELRLLGSIAETYDDNINASPNKENDFITTLMLGAGLLMETKTQTLDLLGHIYQDIYYDHKNLNSNYQDISLNYKKMFSEYDYFSITDTFSHQPQARDFRSSFAQQNGRDIYSNNIILTVERYIFNYIVTNIHYSNSVYKSTEDQNNSSISNGAGASLGYSTNSLNIISLFYDFVYTKFNQEENGEDQSYKFNIHYTGLSCQYYLTDQLHILAMGGIQFLTSSDVNEHKPFFSFSLIDNIDINNTINVTVSKKYEIAPQVNEIFDSWIFSSVFTRQLSPLLDFSLSIFYENGKTASDIVEYKSKLYGAGVSLSYYLGYNLFTSSSYTYTKSKTESQQDAVEIDYDRNQFRVALNAEF